MNKAARFSLMGMFALLVGYTLLSSGEHPARVLLILGGLLLLPIRGNAIMDRARMRRGGSPGLASSLTEMLADASALTRRDWRELALTAVASIGLLIVGFAAFSRAA